LVHIFVSDSSLHLPWTFLGALNMKLYFLAITFITLCLVGNPCGRIEAGGPLKHRPTSNYFPDEDRMYESIVIQKESPYGFSLILLSLLDIKPRRIPFILHRKYVDGGLVFALDRSFNDFIFPFGKIHQNPNFYVCSYCPENIFENN
jgi:hypothetical protein